MIFELPPTPPAIIVVQDVASTTCVPYDWCRPAAKEDDRGSGRVDDKR
jgi:hypothetical protein